LSAKSGAGASVSSGASYQARVGAFSVAAALCERPVEFCDSRRLVSIGFETSEHVDDINIHTEDGGKFYIQAKSRIEFSTLERSEFVSVITQFLRQDREAASENSNFLLVTGSRSSSTIIESLRVGLNAFRTSDEATFRRDQNKTIVQTLDYVISIIQRIQHKLYGIVNADNAKCILRKTSVVRFDIEDDDPLSQAIILTLGASNFVSPTALWGRIISDCVNYAKSRRTLNVDVIRDIYSRYQLGESREIANDEQSFFNVVLSSKFSVGREVLLCDIPTNDHILQELRSSNYTDLTRIVISEFNSPRRRQYSRADSGFL
jgi:hypothetical protein